MFLRLSKFNKTSMLFLIRSQFPMEIAGAEQSHAAVSNMFSLGRYLISAKHYQSVRIGVLANGVGLSSKGRT